MRLRIELPDDGHIQTHRHGNGRATVRAYIRGKDVSGDDDRIVATVELEPGVALQVDWHGGEDEDWHTLGEEGLET